MSLPCDACACRSAAQAASKKEAKDARRLLQRGQQQQDEVVEEGEGVGGGWGLGSTGGTPDQLHYQFASFERHTSGALCMGLVSSGDWHLCNKWIGPVSSGGRHLHTRLSLGVCAQRFI